MFDTVAKNTLVPLLLRLVLAAIFIYHGLNLISSETNWGAGWANNMPNRPPQLESAPAQLAVAWGQLIGGIALGVGFLTRVAALGIIAIMAGAIYTVHLPHGFDITKGGYEYNVAIIVMCVVLVLTGGGTLAVDRVFRLRRKPVLPGP